ncbi:MAG: tRNA (adenosine(37)-N6)-threonylcarbamoyltransferase complex dimerization subunit type 1 TsaB [Parachlamydiales bacterium]|nr:tRNA (adenosine(37)-N6)-threonylcarbamoyltransferase complex dimerization subunit type 1 TsaB [Parachlamydiales bacterium]
MLILTIESSAEKGCLVLSENEKVLASIQLEGGPQLSRTIAQEVKNLLSNQVPALVAVGIGPGSYTGIRVGAALAKALSYGWQIPCLGFCSLKAFGPAPILMDAKSGGVYAWFGDKAFLLPRTDARVQGMPLCTHPPDPTLLAKVVWDQFSEEGAPPFLLDYGIQ